MWGIALQSVRKWLSGGTGVEQRIKDIAKLSQDIEKRISETLTPIEEKTAPEEIRPLINALNRLVAYFEDRSQHEQDFSGNVSHELRTPLTGIRIQTELAMASNDPDIHKKAHENILESVKRGERLIEQLLVLSRLTADRVQLKMKDVNIGQLSAHVVAELVQIAEKNRVKLKMYPWKDCYVRANKGGISVMIHNLIRNAINYSPEGGEVSIKVVSESNKVLISVTDNGLGIPPEKYELITRRFEKVDNESTAGSGLGLSIVKRICDLHHATLKFDKATRKGGLKVTVALDC